ncbi:MAG: transglutaminase-like domain-containing protein [Clostridia bacterium]|nr:transglutaminase-like domain-containing protein [Clostridia bacterium]
MQKSKKLKIAALVCGIILVLGLLASIGVNIWLAYFSWDSYLQSTDEIYIMEAGILKNNLEFRDGEDFELTYDFSHEDYAELKSKYGLEKTAGEGSEFERACRLMDEFAPRLKHKSDYDNHIEMRALSLLEYSLDNKKYGINCRSKAQILNEACLALGMYSRKVWIMPNSVYDNDCHVVNEVWDTKLNKWVMLDITNNEYWVDENGTPLSVLEIRYKGAEGEFCTPVEAGEKLKNLQKLKQKNIGDFLYIMKNMTYTRYCENYTVGESEKKLSLVPKNLQKDYNFIISEAAVNRSPIKT